MANRFKLDITKEEIEAIFKSFERKDLNEIMDHFSDDAILIDPHYPIPKMIGKKMITKGLTWGLKTLVSARFKTENFWISGNEGAIRLKTNHVLKGGKELDTIQVFLFTLNQEKKITYLQSFVPYRPSGLSGLISRITGLFWKKE